MHEIINEKISVISLYNRETGVVIPKKIRWQAKEYLIKSLSYHHKVRIGRNLLHIFHVTDGNLDFRLSLNTDNLQWCLEEVSDGQSA